MSITAGPTNFITKVRNRFRYGLATQEILDRLAFSFGLVIYPYLVRYERISASPSIDEERATPDHEIRPLTEHDMQYIATHGVYLRSTDSLIAELRNGSRGFGLFVDGELASYSWFRFDRVATPLFGKILFKLHDDEAYVYNTYTLPAFRGNGLTRYVHFAISDALRKLGRFHSYSIILANNSSARRALSRVPGAATELRLLIGIKRWNAVDFRLRKYSGRLRTPALSRFSTRSTQNVSS